MTSLQENLEPWPKKPRQPRDDKDLELEKTLYSGRVEAAVDQLEWERAEKTRLATEDADRDAAAWTAEYALEKAVHDARIEVAKAAIERSQAGAEFIRNAAAGTATIYSGVLALTFAGAETADQAPARAIVPALFLGIALVAAAAYVAFLTRGESVSPPTPHSALRVYQERRLNRFVEWVASYAYRRAYALHAAVLSLAFGVAFLPMPFINLKGWVVVAVSVGGLLVVLHSFEWDGHASGGVTTSPPQQR